MRFLRPVTAIFLIVAALAAAPARALPIERVVSPEGIEAWLVEDHTVPVVSLGFLFRGGAGLDPQGKAGLASFVAGMLDEGAGDLDSQAFQQRLADLSISLHFSAGLDTFSGSLRTLSENREAAFSLLRLALTEPRFDSKPLERVRSQILTGLVLDDERPEIIASRVWFGAAFPDHPYGRPNEGTQDGVAAVTADDLRRFVRERLGRDTLIIGVAGDITAGELVPLLESTFGGLPARAEPYELAETNPSGGGVIVVERDIPQSVVAFGESCLKRDDPDYFAAGLLNYVIGGDSFISRLGSELRVKRGLTYSVYSYLLPYAHTGLLLGGVSTENSRVAESLGLIRVEWRRVAAQGILEHELEGAKSFLIGSFPLRLSSTGNIAQMMVSFQYHDLGIDYMERRNELINSVTREDIRRVARKFFRADDLLFVIVGRPEGISATREAPPET